VAARLPVLVEVVEMLLPTDPRDLSLLQFVIVGAVEVALEPGVVVVGERHA